MDNMIMSSLAFIGAVIPIVSILIKLNITNNNKDVIKNTSKYLTCSKIYSLLSLFKIL